MISMMVAMVAGMAMAQTAPPTQTAVFYFDARGTVVALDICDATGCVPADLSDWTGGYADGRGTDIHYVGDPTPIPATPPHPGMEPIFGWTNCREDWELQQSVCDWDVVEWYDPACTIC